MTTIDAYRKLFLTETGAFKAEAVEVLKDLSEFCRFTRSTVAVSMVQNTVDPLATILAEGRREVFLKVVNNLSPDVYDLYNRMIRQRAEENNRG